MRLSIKRAVIGVAMSLLSALAFAADKGTAEEAIALVKKATAHIKANGAEKAFAEFNNPSGQFIDRDLYIAVFDMKGVNVAHGTNPKLIGKNLMELKDVDGKTFIKSWYEVAAKSGSGWVDYKWTNPTTKVIEKKSTYVEKFGDYLVACGIYR